jgi:cobalt-zinc-cadmium efflux system outer membrane protein
MPWSSCRNLAGLLAAGLAAAAPALGAPPAGQSAVRPPDTAAVRPPDTAVDPFAGQARLDRAAFLRQVVRRNPSLAALRQGWQAAEARRRGAAELPEPTLSLALTPLAFGGGSGSFAAILEARQALPLPSRRRLGAASAAAEAGAAAGLYPSALVELVAAASLLYDDDYMVYRSLAITAEYQRLAEELRRAAGSRYAAGLAPLAEPLAAEIEAAKLLHRTSELETERALIEIRIAGLLHALPAAVLPPPPEQLPPPAPADLPAADAEQAALAGSSELAASRAAVETRRTEAALARLDRHPDLALTGSYDSRWGAWGQRLTAGVAVGLPVRGERLAGERAAAEARLEQAESELAAAEDRVRAAARSAALQLDEALHVREIYKGRLLPASRDQLRAARSAFEVGQGSLSAVLEAERNLREVEIEDEQALVDVYRRRAGLERALGRLPADVESLLAEPAAAAAEAPR